MRAQIKGCYFEWWTHRNITIAFIQWQWFSFRCPFSFFSFLFGFVFFLSFVLDTRNARNILKMISQERACINYFNKFHSVLSTIYTAFKLIRRMYACFCFLSRSLFLFFLKSFCYHSYCTDPPNIASLWFKYLLCIFVFMVVCMHKSSVYYWFTVKETIKTIVWVRNEHNSINSARIFI